MTREQIDPDIKLLIEDGRQKGYLTYEEINRVLPDDLVSPERLDGILMQLDEMGIQLLDEAEVASTPASTDEDDSPRQRVAIEEEEDERAPPDETAPFGTGSAEKIDDPVRMYLTQMGEIPLLTRDEEIMLAKKIELTRRRYRRKVLESAISQDRAIRILEEVIAGELAFDRTLKINTSGETDKEQLATVLPYNLATVKLLRLKSGEDFGELFRGRHRQSHRAKLLNRIRARRRRIAV
ncbi:MAG: RNA polymerase subunit sigma-70, partial [Planctomycetota bacterium]|nr:RNA polymerase subunit sigma-70 [Planctomycetota bacterium]